MVIDYQTLLSSSQAVTADAASTNIYDTGSAADIGPGEILRVFAVITEAFDNCTSIAFQLQCDDNSGFSSAKTLWSATYLLASLTLGAKIKLPPVPAGAERYLRLYYDVTGTAPTVGKITAGMVLNDQNWTSMAD